MASAQRMGKTYVEWRAPCSALPSDTRIQRVYSKSVRYDITFRIVPDIIAVCMRNAQSKLLDVMSSICPVVNGLCLFKVYTL